MTAAEKAKQEAAQGAASSETTGQAGIQSEIEVGAKNPATNIPVTLMEAQTPEWVSEILASNQEVLESNQEVINSVAAFKESANELISEMGKNASPETKQAAQTVSSIKEFNPYADYEVAEGKEFRAPNDFTTIHKEGDNVSHLGAAKLQTLLEQGLVIEVDPED